MLLLTAEKIVNIPGQANNQPVMSAMVILFSPHQTCLAVTNIAP